ncbi:uncharacterized protein B0T23DRAFT_165847 [Neurospora hispaniola]|uniref:Uncharacterized protein n=1 Tax=Neurospora hispaniola TaxID=588809 RepID=A0AAJ0I5F6_9PEZI|nr:hypothetical protein B0T23DRAFT_165847 [Neurospora hispaniola]
MPDDDEQNHRRSAAPNYADPDSDLDSDLHSIKSPSHPPLPSLTTTTSGSPVRATTQTSPRGLQSPLGFGSPPQGSSSNLEERQLISHPQTPPNHPQSGRNRYALHQHGSRSPSPSPSSHHLPPPAASTLYHLVGGLGLGPSSPLSPFRRQFSAPLQAVRSSSRAPSFASIAGSHPGSGYGYGSGSGNSFFTHVNDSRGTVHHLAVKDDDNDNTLSFHADDELSDDDDQHKQYPRVRADTAAANKAEDDKLTQDSKDVLVERLTDLIHHLQEAKEPTVTSHGVLSDVSISELHAKVDEMEAVLNGKGTGTGLRGIDSGDGPAGAAGVTGGLRVTKRPVRPSARRSRRSQASSPRPEENGGESESGGEGDKEEGEEQLHSPLKDIRAFESSAAAAAATAPGWLAKNFSGSEPSPPESRAHSPSPSSKVHLKLAEAAEITPSVGAGTASVSVAAVEVEAVKRRGAETERIAAESEKLAAQLEAVLKSLETRREESNHVHALLVERAEAAASRILELEKEVLDLLQMQNREDEVSYQESELKHLRLELRAIETLVNEFLPPVEAADPELVRSIENWKADWKRLRDQMLSKSRRTSKSKSEINHHLRQHETDPEGQNERPRDEKKKDTKHEHEHELHKEKEEVKAYETHELSVVEEVTEESLRQGHHYHYHPHHHHHQQQQQQQQQQQPESNGRAVLGSGVDGLEEEGSTGESVMNSHGPPAHAARVSRTGA